MSETAARSLATGGKESQPSPFLHPVLIDFPAIISHPVALLGCSRCSSTNAYYVEEMHRRWRQDPSSVHASWDVYFSGVDNGMSPEQAYRPPPSLTGLPLDAGPVDHESLSSGAQNVDDHLKLQLLVRAYQVSIAEQHVPSR